MILTTLLHEIVEDRYQTTFQTSYIWHVKSTSSSMRKYDTPPLERWEPLFRLNGHFATPRAKVRHKFVRNFFEPVSIVDYAEYLHEVAFAMTVGFSHVHDGRFSLLHSLLTIGSFVARGWVAKKGSKVVRTTVKMISLNKSPQRIS